MSARTQEVIRNNIMKLNSIDELLDVRLSLKLRWNQLTQLNTMSFKEGDRVNICHTGRRAGLKDAGTIEKINIKTVLVKADSGTKWKCSPNVLEKV